MATIEELLRARLANEETAQQQLPQAKPGLASNLLTSAGALMRGTDPVQAIQGERERRLTNISQPLELQRNISESQIKTTQALKEPAKKTKRDEAFRAMMRSMFPQMSKEENEALSLLGAEEGKPMFEALRDMREKAMDRAHQIKLEQLKAGLATKKDEKPSDVQRGAATFATRASKAHEIVRLHEKIGAKGGFTGRFAKLAPGELKSSERQQLEQAERDFVNAVLRKESGAAISPAEFKNARQQYFPQPGDTTEVLTQKAQNRETAIAGLSAQAGDKALSDVQARILAQQPKDNLTPDEQRELEQLRMKYGSR